MIRNKLWKKQRQADAEYSTTLFRFGRREAIRRAAAKAPALALPTQSAPLKCSSAEHYSRIASFYWSNLSLIPFANGRSEREKGTGKEKEKEKERKKGMNEGMKEEKEGKRKGKRKKKRKFNWRWGAAGSKSSRGGRLSIVRILADED
jgi:hypothetical protein